MTNLLVSSCIKWVLIAQIFKGKMPSKVGIKVAHEDIVVLLERARA